MVATPAEYLVVHGKTGALGRFTSCGPEGLQRGDRVVVRGDRGQAIGVVLREASARQARLLGASAPGQLLRKATPEDEAARRDLAQREQALFEVCRKTAVELQLPLEILDCELALDGQVLILQYLLAATCDAQPLVSKIAAEHCVEVWLENLALPKETDEAEHGCGEPNCGRADGGKGCDTCSTGGGCSSCGSGGVKVDAYFAHLRAKKDDTARHSLL
jgi:cell fate regulator YaaT (PSP1 superfamily)